MNKPTHPHIPSTCEETFHLLSSLLRLSPLAGEQHGGVHASADQDALLPLLPGHARRQALQELLPERHERLPGQPGRPGPGVEPVHR